MVPTETGAAPSSTRDGRRWEQYAETFLTGRGMRCIARNHRCRGGEIDLIMLACELVVFVEVRYRRSTRFGTAAESVDLRKQQRIICAAQDFLMHHEQYANNPCRFDVLALGGKTAAPVCDWIAGAFSA